MGYHVRVDRTYGICTLSVGKVIFLLTFDIFGQKQHAGIVSIPSNGRSQRETINMSIRIQ